MPWKRLAEVEARTCHRGHRPEGQALGDGPRPLDAGVTLEPGSTGRVDPGLLVSCSPVRAHVPQGTEGT